MGGLNALEVGDDNDRSKIQKLWFRGGFPDNYLTVDNRWQ
jgi:hypothetical protein